MVQAKKPAAPCPKCGDSAWDGPKFCTNNGFHEEGLQWTCNTCGFKAFTKCLDAKP